MDAPGRFPRVRTNRSGCRPDEHLQNSEGWELGTGPSLMVVDEGMAKQLSTRTLITQISPR
jgi:hypothetical protein